MAERKRYVLIDRPQRGYRQGTTGVVNLLDYLIGIPVFGAVYFILTDPLNMINSSIVATNQDWAMYLWAASLVIYLIFGAFWFLNRLRER